MPRIDTKITSLETEYQLRSSVPALTFAAAALGLTLGLALVLRRRRLSPRLAVEIGVLSAFVLELSLPMIAIIATAIGGPVAPVFFAWLPVTATLLLALVLWCINPADAEPLGELADA